MLIDFSVLGEEQAKLFQSNQDILTKGYGRFQDYYNDTAMMNKLKKLPLSYIKCPERDLEICRETGFQNIETEMLVQEKYWDPFIALRYRTMPTFVIKAKK